VFARTTHDDFPVSQGVLIHRFDHPKRSDREADDVFVHALSCLLILEIKGWG
jgi:hypothetical protein